MSLPSISTVPAFKEADQPNRELCTKPPQCILDLPEEEPGRPSLTNQEYKAATSLKTKDFISLEFPRTMKLHTDPPLPGQYVSLVTFIPSKQAVPDPEGCYGVMKIRGVFDNVNKADKYSEYLIRDHDSYGIYDFVWVGKPFPVMKDNSMYRLQTKEVDIRTKINNTIKEDLKEKKEIDKQQMSEVQERHKQLMSDVADNKEQNFDDLDFYVQMKTKRANLLYRDDDLKQRMDEGKKLLIQLEKELRDLEKQHPEYKEQFLKKYKDACSTAGISEGANPLMKYMTS
jgi:hypothetical protein